MSALVTGRWIGVQVPEEQAVRMFGWNPLPSASYYERLLLRSPGEDFSAKVRARRAKHHRYLRAKVRAFYRARSDIAHWVKHKEPIRNG